MIKDIEKLLKERMRTEERSLRATYGRKAKILWRKPVWTLVGAMGVVGDSAELPLNNASIVEMVQRAAANKDVKHIVVERESAVWETYRDFFQRGEEIIEDRRYAAITLDALGFPVN